MDVEHISETRIQPLPNPNLSDLRSIPLGSEVIVINYEGEPPSIGCLGWDEESMKAGEENLDEDNPEDRYTGTFMAFLPPGEARAYSGNVIPENDIVEKALESLETVKDLAGMTLLIRMTIQEARRGLVENPF